MTYWKAETDVPPAESANRQSFTSSPEHTSSQKDKLSMFILTASVPLGVAHNLGMLWKQRDFLSSSGTPIKNGQKVNDLLTAILLSYEVAVIEIRVPTGKTGPEYQGMPQLISAQRQQLNICED